MRTIELALELTKIMAPVALDSESSIPQNAENIAECLNECLNQINLNNGINECLEN